MCIRDRCCPSLSYTQRIIGFCVCCAVGLLLTLGSFFRFKQCIDGDCTGFAVIYTIGNIVAVMGSFFLSGPCKQLKSCFEMGRLCATCTFLFFLIFTLVIALVDGIESSTRIPLVLLSCLCQLLAYVWYSLSYIPFAHTCIKSACKGFFPCLK
eukprot:TRINITY_DN8959_c0_g7_i1.p1 TRINITY_DN8959_c0_g7~~TRINITY_DN8959_c0_g7_i1.p1  ORF type:complete len:153 (-),score=30.13 TRINITY_DN8959_c0_g7_i1:345-803(-)